MKDNEYAVRTTIGDEVTCPYCRFKVREELVPESGDAYVVDCPECGKKFRSFANVVIEYTSYKDCTLNNEEHDWVKCQWFGAEKYGAEECAKCGMHRLNVGQTKKEAV